MKKPTSPKKDKWLDTVIKLVESGMSDSFISTHMGRLIKGKGVDKRTLDLIAQANAFIANEALHKAKTVRLSHLLRYNIKINRLLKTEELSEADIEKDATLEVSENGEITESPNRITYRQWLAARNKKIKAYDEALDSLFQKENVMHLYLHHLTVRMIDEDEEKTKEKEIKDFTKLSFEEQVELMNLMQMTKVDGITSASVKTSDYQVPEEVQETVEFIDPLPNIEKIGHEDLPVKPKIELSIVDPTQQFKEALKRLAAKKMSEAGFNLDDEEKKYLNTDR